MNRILFICILMGVFTSCKEDYIGQPPTDNIAPQPVSNVEVTNIYGGAEISYDLPEETDISYVKGIYKVNNEEYVVRSSIYNNKLKIEGLGSTDPLDINLFVVDHSENSSQPYTVTINPLTPVVDLIMESVQMRADFGGVNIKWINDMETEIGLTLLAANDKGNMEEGETYYSQTKEGNYSFRGYSTDPRKFALCITDKWGNVSDTLKEDITPMYEMIIDKKQIKRVLLPSDISQDNGSYIFTNMFDENVKTMWHTKEGAQEAFPVCFTIDLAKEGKLSRFKLYHRDDWAYRHYNPKSFEVWGCVNYKDGMLEEYWKEEWKNDWIKLGDFITFKPSGEGPITNEDTQYASKGFEYSIPVDTENIRYLRFVVKSTWGGAPNLHIAELSFWGDFPQN